MIQYLKNTIQYLKNTILNFKTSSDEVSLSPVIREMIKRVSGLTKLTVRDIMVPRIDVTTISYNSSNEEIIDIIKKDGHSRFPVWDKSVDDIVGLLYVKDLSSMLLTSSSDFKLRSVLRKVHFIPESKKVIELLKEFQIKKNHLAVVVDEYGGLSGIVALEDILEEIVGDIRDEYDKEEDEWIVQISRNVYMLDSRNHIEQINKSLGVNLKENSADTIGGFVFNLFGQIPKEKEYIEFENFMFQVVKLDGNRIVKIKMEIKSEDKNVEITSDKQ